MTMEGDADAALVELRFLALGILRVVMRDIVRCVTWNGTPGNWSVAFVSAIDDALFTVWLVFSQKTRTQSLCRFAGFFWATVLHSSKWN